MTMIAKVCFFGLGMILTLAAQAQETRERERFGVEGQFTFETDKPFRLLELDETTSEPVVVAKKKKPKKNTFYGIKTRKGYARRGTGDRATLELFYTLKTPERPSPFVRDIYWYDYTRREVRKTANFDIKKGVLLHGPYKKMQNNVVIEEGIFYKGTKHGRWMQFDRHDIVSDKEKYYKGWPKESIVTYYDPVERKKVKEMIPVEIDEREGFYFLFHENGTIAVSGEYKWDQKVGDWVENYPNGKRKRILAYPTEPYDDTFKPFIRKEWDEKGREIFTSNKG
jgi:antitoxin component YwqK of YwqJK toxin-antitoxin module